MDKNNKNGDEDFENFLNNISNGGQSSEDYKRIILDILNVKITSAADLLNTLSSTRLKIPNKEKRVSKLIEITENSFNQLDYLLSVVLDDLDESGKNGIK